MIAIEIFTGDIFTGDNSWIFQGYFDNWRGLDLLNLYLFEIEWKIY